MRWISRVNMRRDKSEDAPDFEAVVTASAAKQIAESIRGAILDGKLKIAARLPSEDDLASQFKVSRPTIREALKRLAAQNLIRSRRGPTGGNFVTSPAPVEAARSLTNTTTLMVAVGDIGYEDMITARFEMESICLRLACINSEEGYLARLRAEIDYQTKSGITDEEFCASDIRFHRIIADASCNSLMKFLMHSVIEALQPISNMIIFRIRERKEIVGFHKRVHDALSKRKQAAAIDALADLIEYTRSSYQKTFALHSSKLDGRADQA